MSEEYTKIELLLSSKDKESHKLGQLLCHRLRLNYWIVYRPFINLTVDKISKVVKAKGRTIYYSIEEPSDDLISDLKGQQMLWFLDIYKKKIILDGGKGNEVKQ